MNPSLCAASDVYSSFSLSFTVLFFFLYLKILFNMNSFVNPKLVKKSEKMYYSLSLG